MDTNNKEEKRSRRSLPYYYTIVISNPHMPHYCSPSPASKASESSSSAASPTVLDAQAVEIELRRTQNLLHMIEQRMTDDELLNAKAVFEDKRRRAEAAKIAMKVVGRPLSSSSSSSSSQRLP